MRKFLSEDLEELSKNIRVCAIRTMKLKMETIVLKFEMDKWFLYRAVHKIGI